MPLCVFAQYERDYYSFLNTKATIDYNIESELSFNENHESFPNVDVETPMLVKHYMGGDYTIDVRWFDSQLNELDKPNGPGRYAYYAEIVGENGDTLRRSSTIFCAPADWYGWSERPLAELDYFEFNNISPDVWAKANSELKEYAGYIFFKSLLSNQEAMVYLSYLDEVAKGNYEQGINPLIMDGDYHAQLKQKILGVEDHYSPLSHPGIVVEKDLRVEKSRKYKKFAKEVNALCQEWTDESGIPFNLIIAKDGKTVVNNAYGETLAGQWDIKTQAEIASITKLFTGILFARFVDQGIIDIDDPVGKYLPGFAIEGEGVITLRHCFYHTIGYMGHGSYGGVMQPWHDSTLSLLAKRQSVGKYHIYNGLGYNLAGKVMEVVAGKSVFRLMKEQILDPLGMTNTKHYGDLAYSIYSNAEDLAKLALLISNKGEYQGVRLFSEATYDDLTPKLINDYFPGTAEEDKKWGIGFTQMSDQDSTIIGHGAATNAVLNVYSEDDIVMTMSRMIGGDKYDDYMKKLNDLIDQYLR